MAARGCYLLRSLVRRAALGTDVELTAISWAKFQSVAKAYTLKRRSYTVSLVPGSRRGSVPSEYIIVERSRQAHR